MTVLDGVLAAATSNYDGYLWESNGPAQDWLGPDAFETFDGNSYEPQVAMHYDGSATVTWVQAGGTELSRVYAREKK